LSRKGKRIVTKRKEAAEDLLLEFDFTLDQAFDYFVSLKKAEGVRERTMLDYHVLMRCFLDWLGSTYPKVIKVNEINKGIIREFAVYLGEEHLNARTGKKGLSPYTVNVRIRFLKAFFNALFREQIVDKNPVKDVRLMRVDEDTFEPLTDNEIEVLLGVPNTREYAQYRDLVIMYLMLDTGMRISEVCELEVKDVDFKTRAIILPAHKNKNRKPRILPLSNHVNKLLLELVSENKAYFDTDYVFLANCGTKYNPNSFRRRLSNYKEKAAIKKRVSPHAFRHLFCRNFILNGGDIFTLQRIAGHADISTTRKYIQMTNDDVKAQHAQYSPVLRLRKKFK
jgi:integrase/recombinase XerD